MVVVKPTLSRLLRGDHGEYGQEVMRSEIQRTTPENDYSFNLYFLVSPKDGALVEGYYHSKSVLVDLLVHTTAEKSRGIFTFMQ